MTTQIFFDIVDIFYRCKNGLWGQIHKSVVALTSTVARVVRLVRLHGASRGGGAKIVLFKNYLIAHICVCWNFGKDCCQ